MGFALGQRANLKRRDLTKAKTKASLVQGDLQTIKMPAKTKQMLFRER